MRSNIVKVSPRIKQQPYPANPMDCIGKRAIKIYFKSGGMIEKLDTNKQGIIVRLDSIIGTDRKEHTLFVLDTGTKVPVDKAFLLDTTLEEFVEANPYREVEKTLPYPQRNFFKPKFKEYREHIASGFTSPFLIVYFKNVYKDIVDGWENLQPKQFYQTEAPAMTGEVWTAKHQNMLDALYNNMVDKLQEIHRITL